ncbi:conserved hypothetical protein, partial [Ricinus communis]
MHDERRKREHHAGREIDFAADHQHDFAARDDGRGRDELRKVLQARACQKEVAVHEFEIGAENQRHHEDARLARTCNRAQPPLRPGTA